MDWEEVQKMKALEKFMERVGQIMGCLPSYSDPNPDGGNAHIIRKIESLQPSNPADGKCPECGRLLLRSTALNISSPQIHCDWCGANLRR